MPLQFESINRGIIAFGFFNIESDMLLLDNNFVFASEFCRNIVDLTEIASEKRVESDWRVWQITKRSNLGDFMDAMHGINYTGFFGELYKKYPFPNQRKDFKQKPDGWKTQEDVKEVIEKYSIQKSIHIEVDDNFKKVFIGEYVFTNTVFGELIKYVWEGGFPKWKDGMRPAYVVDMKESIMKHKSPLFSGLILS